MCDGACQEPEGGEATYSLSHRPTDRPTSFPDHRPDEYISVRLTIDHSRLSDVLSILSDVCHCLWPHNGSKGDNPHYHILLPISIREDPRKYNDKMRKRIKDKLGLSGAGKVMLKSMTNDIVEAVTYCAKEHTSPIYSSDHAAVWQKMIDTAPAWVEKGQQPIQRYMKGTAPRKLINEDHFYQITYQNMEKVTLRYHKRHGTKPDLASTLEHMHKNGWRLNVSVIRGGIPSTFFDEFEAKCKGDTIWKKSRFEFMRVVPNYTRGL